MKYRDFLTREEKRIIKEEWSDGLRAELDNCTDYYCKYHNCENQRDKVYAMMFHLTLEKLQEEDE